MARLTVTLMVVLGLLLASPPGKAGWLEDKLKEVAEEVTEDAIDDAVDDANNEEQEADQEMADEEGMVEDEMNDEGDVGEDEYELYDEYMNPGQPSGGMSKCERYGQNRFGEEDKAEERVTPRDNLYFTSETKYESLEGESESGTMIMHLDGSRMRMDMRSGEQTNFSVIVLGQKPEDKTISLYHTENMYAVSTLGDADNGDVWSISGVFDPCEGYGGVRKDSATIAGRSAVKWSCSNPKSANVVPESTFWMDKKLEVPLAWEDECNRSELIRFIEGRPDKALFEIPEGYRELKFSIPTR